MLVHQYVALSKGSCLQMVAIGMLSLEKILFTASGTQIARA